VGERPWYINFFDDDYLRVFLPVLPDERTAARSTRACRQGNQLNSLNHSFVAHRGAVAGQDVGLLAGG
jgi:hypothetical protein